MNSKGSILIVDDEHIVRESLFHWFTEDNYNVESAEDAEIALKKYSLAKFDVLLVDMKMPGMSGLEFLNRVKEIDAEAIVIIITAFASVPTAIKALKDGAFDYITKPVDPDELSHLVDRAFQQIRLRRENKQMKQNIEETILPDNLIGESMQMKKIFSLIQTVAPTDTTVMIRGESGTGKEIVAKAVHINSPRRYFPIVTVNCGALPETLLESELFGHEKGSFTGAHYRRKGKFEMANGGTIFLDEIGTVTPKMQVELLRVVDTKQFTRLGGNDVITSDFRIIAATNENLEEMVQQGKFREDLYYRLNVFSINVPPLRERKDDIPLLAYHFLKQFTSSMNKKIADFEPEAMDFMVNYNWKGNVRELENAIERAVVVCTEDKIRSEDLPFRQQTSFSLSPEDKSISAMEKVHIARVLIENNWNISRSADILGIDRVTLYNKINKYGLQR
ncbi:MAG: sigma-54-dependent Fis family transcriptional regulator [Ignavibacteriales bacterium]|nr:sigma-54-dependent Fis family transcriptional regulator [Ignavibacteriales bacterium]